MSISAYHALYGEDDNDVEDQNLAVIERRIGKLNKLNLKLGTNFTYYDIWPRTAGSAGSDVATGAQAPIRITLTETRTTPAPRQAAPGLTDTTGWHEYENNFVSKLITSPWNIDPIRAARSSAAWCGNFSRANGLPRTLTVIRCRKCRSSAMSRLFRSSAACC